MKSIPDAKDLKMGRLKDEKSLLSVWFLFNVGVGIKRRASQGFTHLESIFPPERLKHKAYMGWFKTYMEAKGYRVRMVGYYPEVSW